MQFAGFSSPTRNRGKVSKRSSLRSPLRPFNDTSMSMICQTPISSSGRAGRSGFQASSCGKAPSASSTSPTSIGRHYEGLTFYAPYAPSNKGSGGMAADCLF